MLGGAVDRAGAAQLQIKFRQLEAVVGALQSPQAPAGRSGIASQKIAVALDFAPSYPSAQLVQLGQSEALDALYEHDAGIRHIDAHLYHGSGHQDIKVAG